MKTVELAIPYDEFMDVIEDYLVYSGKLKSNEELMWADLGLPIDGDNNIMMNVEVEEVSETTEPAPYLELVS